MTNMRIYQPYIPKQPISKTSNNKKIINDQTLPFQELLKNEFKKSEEIKFSAHAKQRLEKRGINVDVDMVNNLNNAIIKAEKKGAKDSLVLFHNLAFVVNVPNRTVVTAIDDSSMREHIFTNIDSAIII